MSAEYPNTTTIFIAESTFEAWKKGSIALKFNNRDDYIHDEKDFVNVKGYVDTVRGLEAGETSNSEPFSKFLNNINDESVRIDLLYVIYRYSDIIRQYPEGSDRNGSYVYFLRTCLLLRPTAIQRRFAKEEYIDADEWEWMKDEDERLMVLQNPYLRIDHEGDKVRLYSWGCY